jgi:hypothetical protein
MHLLADGRLKDEVALCPTCRCEISKPTCIRNLAVEKAVSELPASCQFCNKSMPRHAIDRHEREVCVARCAFANDILVLALDRTGLFQLPNSNIRAKQSVLFWQAGAVQVCELGL